MAHKDYNVYFFIRAKAIFIHYSVALFYVSGSLKSDYSYDYMEYFT